jgi:hypothetical protein
MKILYALPKSKNSGLLLFGSNVKLISLPSHRKDAVVNSVEK